MIQSVSFKVLTPEDVLRLSVREISTISLYKKDQPHASGPNSLFLGTTSNDFVCATCGLRADFCTGHTGHIPLQRKIVHPLYVGTALKLLRSICLTCFAPLERNGACKACEAKKQPKLVKKGIRIFQDGKAMRGEDIWGMLEASGMQEAEGLVLEHLLVPPVLIRPSVAKVSGSKLRGQDDLTMALVNIIRTNRKIREADAAGKADEADRQEEALRYYVAVYLDKEPRFHRLTNGNKKGGGRSTTIKSLATRLVGKKGRIRANIMVYRLILLTLKTLKPLPETLAGHFFFGRGLYQGHKPFKPFTGKTRELELPRRHRTWMRHGHQRTGRSRARLAHADRT